MLNLSGKLFGNNTISKLVIKQNIPNGVELEDVSSNTSNSSVRELTPEQAREQIDSTIIH